MESRAQLLSRAHSGDRDAVQQMIEENTGLIWSVARRYFGRGVDVDHIPVIRTQKRFAGHFGRAGV